MDRIDAYRQRIASLVAEHGHMIQGVMTDPPFAYTAGLYRTHALPEIVVMGLAPQIAHTILNDVARQMKAGGLTPLGGVDFDEVFAGAPARFRLLGAREVDEHLAIAAAVNGRDDFPAWQLIWPDPQGRFPGDPGCPPMTAALQDLRFTLADAHAGAGH